MRSEEDALGAVLLPDDAYYGVQTQRAVENFAVSGQTFGGQPALVTAIVQVKKAAALANADVGVLRPVVAEAICQAADEVIAGDLGWDQFPVDVLSAGGGVSPNMNINEVLANRANEILTGQRGYEFVHPNNHVNASQSTSDVMATAMNVALHRDILQVRGAVEHLASALADKTEQYRDTVKLSRTCLQDAVPVTFGQSFGAYLAVARRGADRLASAAEACLEVPMGGTVVGTSLGVGAGYLDRIYPRLRETTGLDLRPHPNFFDVFQNGDVFQYISTIFKALACGLVKIAKDLRLLSSGNRAGLGEITLPAVQAGSSFMPGKVNPVMAELVVQVGYQVCGNDTVVTMAVEGAELDFNAWTAVIAKNLLESAKLLTNAMPLFTDKCLRGLEVRADRTRASAANTLGLSTVVGGVYGYEAGARAAYHAARNNTSIADAVVELGIASRATADRLLDPVVLTDGRASSVLLDEMVDEERRRTEALLAGLSPEVRHAMLAAAGAVARADSEVSSQEGHALAVVADALDITPDGRDPFASLGLSQNERELVYSCAAWLASADSVTEAAESHLLARFAEALELDDRTVSALQARITTLTAERRAYLPRSEQLPWWEEFGELVRRLIT